MKIKTNYHSHSTFCDGKSTMEEMVSSAIDKGFTHFGISSHAPYPSENNFALKEENFTAYKQEFERLKSKYAKQINLFLGLEMDFVSGIVENIRQKAEKDYGLDYFIGSVHQVTNIGSPSLSANFQNITSKRIPASTDVPSEVVNTNNQTDKRKFSTWFIDGHDPQVYDNGLKTLFDGDIHKAVGCFYSEQINMIEKNRPDVLGHADKVVMHNRNRYFHEDEQWYKDWVTALFDTVIKYDTIVEVNTRGIYRKRHDDFYPSSAWLKYLVERNVPLTIATDCHKAEETDMCYEDALLYLKSIGCKALYYFDGHWKAEKIDNFRG